MTAASEREAVEQACLEVGLSLSYRSAVQQMLSTPRAQWPACCDTGCEPCMLTYADAALRALALLGRPVP